MLDERDLGIARALHQATVAIEQQIRRQLPFIDRQSDIEIGRCGGIAEAEIRRQQAKQPAGFEAAVEFLDDQLFHTPEWLQDRKVLDKFSDPSTGDAVGILQVNTLRDLLLPIHLVKMLNAAERYGSETYGPGELLDDLEKGIWDELSTGRPVSLLRRNLQKAYVTALDNLLNKPSAGQPSEAANSDAASLARAHLTALGIRVAAAHPSDAATQAHLKDIAVRINLALHHQ